MINEKDAHLLDLVHGPSIQILRNQEKFTSRVKRKKMNECSSRKRASTLMMSRVMKKERELRGPEKERSECQRRGDAACASLHDGGDCGGT